MAKLQACGPPLSPLSADDLIAYGNVVLEVLAAPSKISQTAGTVMLPGTMLCVPTEEVFGVVQPLQVLTAIGHMHAVRSVLLSWDAAGAPTMDVSKWSANLQKLPVRPFYRHLIAYMC